MLTQMMSMMMNLTTELAISINQKEFNFKNIEIEIN